MEIDYNEVFGLDPVEETAETGAEETETAEPSETETVDDEISTDNEGSEEVDAGTAQTSDKQTREENAKYAAARRKAEAERDAAIKKAQDDAKLEADKIIADAFKTSGLVNPYTKEPIRTREEYEAYRNRFGAEKKATLLKKSGMSEEEFNQFVGELPEVREAIQAKEKAEIAEREAHETAAKAKMDKQIEEISSLDPSIKTISDLVKMPTYPRFYELVQRGNDLVDAFRLANFDTLTSKAAAASKQATLNAAQGKSHLAQTQTRGAGAVTVPNDIKDMYRALNPDATDAEIQAHYARNHTK